MPFIEWVGIIGGAAYLLAFIETALGRWDGKSFWYETLNLIGSVMLGIYAIEKQAYTNIALNMIWGVMALYAIRHIVHRRKHRRGKHLNWAKIYKRA